MLQSHKTSLKKLIFVLVDEQNVFADLLQNSDLRYSLVVWQLSLGCCCDVVHVFFRG